MVQLIPGKLSDQTLLYFNWTLTNFTSTDMVIQIDFVNPVLVSSHSDYPDQIFIEIFAI